MLGIGESVGFPCVSKLVAMAVVPARIGLANGVIAFAYLVGPAVGTTLGGLLMDAYGWRVVFVLFGALSLLWLLPWSRVRVAKPMPAAAARADDDAPTFWQILRTRGLWGASLGHFAANYNFYFCLAWLPSYLIKSRDFSIKSMAGLLGFAYLINAVAGLLGGWICDVWIRSGRSASVIYKAMMALNHLVSIAAMVGMALLPLQGSIACLFAYEVVLGLSSPGIYAIPQIMAGPGATGRWVGVQNSCGNMAGIFAPWITGMLIDATGSFDSAFLLAALINVLGLIGWMWILPRVQPLTVDGGGTGLKMPAPVEWRSLEVRCAHLEQHDLAARGKFPQRSRKRFERLDRAMCIAVGTRQLCKRRWPYVDTFRLNVHRQHGILDLAVAVIVPDDDRRPGPDIARDRQLAERKLNAPIPGEADDRSIGCAEAGAGRGGQRVAERAVAGGAVEPRTRCGGREAEVAGVDRLGRVSDQDRLRQRVADDIQELDLPSHSGAQLRQRLAARTLRCGRTAQQRRLPDAGIEQRADGRARITQQRQRRREVALELRGFDVDADQLRQRRETAD